MRNTKIVATVGPASRSPEILRSLLNAGVNVFRINASHGSNSDHAAAITHIREIGSETKLNPGILLDLQGPKIRLGVFEQGQAALGTGSRFRITSEPLTGNGEVASTSYQGLARDVAPGNRVLLADGGITLRALECDAASVLFEVESGGIVRDKQGINLPGVRVRIPSMTEKDYADLEFGLSQNIDMVALSFVRTAVEVRELRQWLASRNEKLPIVAKIEKPEALENLDEIIEACDGVMVARGDLGVEMTLARVPGVQKTVIERARMRGRFVITATQMLESMVQNPTPTRAEVNDVANAIFDGTDAVMLSAETASGLHPLEAVRMMAEIAQEAEDFLATHPLPKAPRDPEPTHAQIIAKAAYHSGLTACVKAIVVFTTSGETVRLIAPYRPRVPIFAFCECEPVARKLASIYGAVTVAPVTVRSVEEMLCVCDQTLLNEGWAKLGDSVILVGGAPFGTAGSANFIKLHRVGHNE